MDSDLVLFGNCRFLLFNLIPTENNTFHVNREYGLKQLLDIWSDITVNIGFARSFGDACNVND